MRYGKSKMAALAVVMSTLGGCGCAPLRADANAWGCKMGKGTWDTKGLKNTLAPGSEDGWGNDEIKNIPADVRFYLVDSDPNTADTGGTPIIVPARGSETEGVGIVQVAVELQVRFVFNERACNWYVDHGKRNEPLNFNAAVGEPSGWQQFLALTFAQKLIESARPTVRNVSYIALYTNEQVDGEAIFTTLEKEIADNLSRELRADLGDTYFCGPTYAFDGDADGEIAEAACPDLEVTVKAIKPVDGALVTNLETIVKNEEALRLIESNQTKELADAQKAQVIALDQERRQQELTLRQTARDQATQLAEQERREAVQVAQAKADLAIAREQAQVREAELANAQLQAQAEAAYCVQLAAAGVDCALLAAAESGNYPPYNFGGQANAPTLLLPAPEP